MQEMCAESYMGTFATVKSYAFLNKLSFDMSTQNNYYVDYSTFKFWFVKSFQQYYK